MSASGRAGAGLRPLLIEDHGAMREMVSDHLCKRGYAVDAAYKGINALATASGYDLDAFILDLGLSNMDGMGGLRARPVVGRLALILTACDPLDGRINGFNAGANDYVPKPFAIPAAISIEATRGVGYRLVDGGPS